MDEHREVESRNVPPSSTGRPALLGSHHERCTRFNHVEDISLVIGAALRRRPPRLSRVILFITGHLSRTYRSRGANRLDARPRCRFARYPGAPTTRRLAGYETWIDARLPRLPSRGGTRRRDRGGDS